MNDEIKEDLRNVAISAGIAWLLMAFGKFIYRHPLGWFFVYIFAMYARWDEGKDMAVGSTAMAWFVFWTLANVIVMMYYGMAHNVRTYSSLFAFMGWWTVFCLSGSLRDASNVHEIVASGGLFLIIGLLLIAAIVRHHIEMLDCYGANVYLLTAGAIGLLCLSLFAASANSDEANDAVASPITIASPPSAVANPDHSGVVTAGTVAPNQSEIDSAERMEVSMTIYRLGKAHVMEALKQCFGDTGVPSQTSWRVDADSIVTLNDPTRWCRYNIATKQALAHDL